MNRPPYSTGPRTDGWILKTLRAAAGERWGDVAYLLGERSRRKDANSGKLLFGKRDD